MKTIVLRVALAALVLIAAAPVPAHSAESFAAASVGQRAPEIRVKDWIGGDGRTTLADFGGEVVFLEFWATHCPASRAQVPHLTKLQERWGAKGLSILAITGEDRSTVLRYMAHEDAGFGYAVALGDAPEYPCPGLPYAALIGPDGNVEYLGEPGGVPSKTIEALLKKVVKPTADEQAARAAKMLESAEALVASKDLLRAAALFAKVEARFPASDAARKAGARAKDIQSGDFAAEFAAQTELQKLVGGAERPSEADTKRMSKLVKPLEKKAADWKTSAPRAAELATLWRDIAAETWAEANAKRK
ncbi:MAG: TlpA family protein disulfide reductase [Planctomycetes bacterium]|nr:TlpA family protein disulfide reductase [Planctomycetota bacterium]